jgi:hypothetical protein
MNLIEIKEKLELAFNELKNGQLISEPYNVLVQSTWDKETNESSQKLLEEQDSSWYINPRILAKIFTFLDQNDLTEKVKMGFNSKMRTIMIYLERQELLICHQQTKTTQELNEE